MSKTCTKHLAPALPQAATTLFTDVTVCELGQGASLSLVCWLLLQAVLSIGGWSEATGSHIQTHNSFL